MATNLCAECGTRLPRPEYKTHMQQVHGVSVMDDSDDEHAQKAQVPGQTTEAAEEAPRPPRQRRGGRNRASERASDEPAVNGGEASAVEGVEGAPRAGGGRRRGRRPAAEDGKGEGEFACTECDRAFTTAQGLVRHTQAKHAGSAPAMDAATIAAAAAPPRIRRGGRPRPAATAGETTENSEGAPAPAADGAAAPDARPARKRGPRKPRAAAAAAPPPNSKAAEAAATAAEAAAPGGSPPQEPKPERLVTLLRCKLCEQGFKSKNRARSHVAEAHPDALPAKAAEEDAPAVGEGEAPVDYQAKAEATRNQAVPADELLELVQVSARRTSRSQARRGRKPRAPANANGEVSAEGEPGPRAGTGVVRGGRPPKKSAATAAAASIAGGEPAAEAPRAATTSDCGGSAGTGKVTDELAALGIVSSS
ncbi:hypothetical protein Vretimale_3008 [Volvox reticuliferus]|uniref:C2H2-type domain-containing protein n=1 Tax=Volvox reticuliferus TaxID=1737510 RepID=A0A8J4FI65_9CHLO|nr:hypothetical protein Vretifemale_6819 [Volvox reticuliferus]GIL97352.1 hypothetical protein Vretimale_3008 [Volvox reticuliferus]